MRHSSSLGRPTPKPRRPWSRRELGPIGLACSLVLLPTLARADAGLAKDLPGGAVGYVEVRELGPVIDYIREAAYWKQLETAPEFETIRKGDGFERFKAGVRFTELQLGTDLATAARRLLGGRLAVALYPPPEGSETPGLVAVLEAEDPKYLAQLLDKLEATLTLFDPDAIQADPDAPGKPVLVRGDQGPLYLIRCERGLIAASSEELRAATYARLSGADAVEGAPLADSATLFQPAVESADPTAQVFAYADVATIRTAMGGALPVERADNFVAAMLFTGIGSAAVGSDAVTGTLRLEPGVARLTVATHASKDDEQPAGPLAAFRPEDGSGATAPLPAVPGFLGGLTLYRDLNSLYRDRENLLKREALPGVDQFEDGLKNLLPGRDFASDVLPAFGHRYRLVVARQTFEHLQGRPSIELPAFGLIAEMADAKKGADLYQLVFQTVVMIANFESAKNGREPMVLAGEQYGDTFVSYGRYLEPPASETLPIGFNFTPASAVVKDQFVFATSIDLCRNLVDALRGEAPMLSPNDSQLVLDAAGLFELFDANRKLLLARMIEDGKTPDRAQAELTGIEWALKTLDKFDLRTELGEETGTLTLEVTW